MLGGKCSRLVLEAFFLCQHQQNSNTIIILIWLTSSKTKTKSEYISSAQHENYIVQLSSEINGILINSRTYLFNFYSLSKRYFKLLNYSRK